jgi:streptomycin 6-kinase
MIVPPGEFVQSKLAEGPETTKWLADLPGLVEELLEQWNCEPDGAVMHGQVAIVVPVQHSQHGSCVLKVSFPHPGNVHEPDAYAAWSGRGAVMLHERDDERFALLLERATTSTLLDGVTDADEDFSVAGSLSRRLAIAAPPELPLLAEEADG